MMPNQSPQRREDPLQSQHTACAHILYDLGFRDPHLIIAERADPKISRFHAIYQSNENYIEAPHAVFISLNTSANPNTLTGAPLYRAYALPIPTTSSTSFLEDLVNRFNTSPIENFEAFFSERFGSIPMSAPEPSEQGLPRIDWALFFNSLDAAELVVERTNGSCLSVQRGMDGYVVVLSASDSERSERLTFEISGSDTWRSPEPIKKLLLEIGGLDKTELSTPLEKLQKKTSRTISFPGTENNSPALMTAATLWTAQYESVAKVFEPTDLSVISTASRILARENTACIQFHDAPSLYKQLSITLDHGGHGSIEIDIGHKILPWDTRTHNVERLGALCFELNLSDYSEVQREIWLHRLTRKFIDSQSTFPGELGDFITEQQTIRNISATPLIAALEPILCSVSTLSKAELFQYFIDRATTSLTSSLYKPNQSTIRELARSEHGVVLEATNTAGDRLQLTVRPSGIDEFFILPRLPLDGASSDPSTIGFYAGHLYQFKPNKLENTLYELARFFSSENGEVETFRDYAGREAPSIGARKSATYLRYRLALQTTSLHAPLDFICIAPPSPDDRIASSNSFVLSALAHKYASSNQDATRS